MQGSFCQKSPSPVNFVFFEAFLILNSSQNLISLLISIFLRRDEYEALFGKGTGPLILARTDSLVTDGFGKPISIEILFGKTSYHFSHAWVALRRCRHQFLQRMLFRDAWHSVRQDAI